MRIIITEATWFMETPKEGDVIAKTRGWGVRCHRRNMESPRRLFCWIRDLWKHLGREMS